MSQACQSCVNQGEFVDFLIASGVLIFGDFTTKSGRKTPYFVNTGYFDDGAKIQTLGKYYAAKIAEIGLADQVDIIFGPAYKGIPLCVTTAAALNELYGKKVGFTFDRKEEKDHGDGGSFVGKKIKEGSRVVIVEDVVTAGTTIRAMVPVLRKIPGVEIKGVVVSADRCEKGQRELSAVKELESEMSVSIHPIVSIHDIRKYLRENPSACPAFTEDVDSRLEDYLKTYGA